MTDTPTPREFAATISDLPHVDVDEVAVKDAYAVELARARKPHGEPTSPNNFVKRLKKVAELDAPDFVDVLVAAKYEHHINAARTSAADNR